MNEAINTLIDRSTFSGGQVDLREQPTQVEGAYDSKQEYRSLLRSGLSQLTGLQWRLYVEGAKGLVIILHGIDTAGKDGIIRHVLSAFNPQGCRVYSFGVPNSEEVKHDILWRTSRFLPERGQISVFNRSHYEEVLTVRVHPEFLVAQHVDPATVEDGSVWPQRFEAIRAHERHLLASGTRVVKLVLHISPDEQAKRLIARITNPAKSWKFQEADVEERRYLDEYMSAYSACLSSTATPEAPWYVLPADDKRTARLLAAGIIIRTLENMQLPTHEVPEDRAGMLNTMKQRLQ
jgi:PPK2 family polyphosphate:nucleotide phosphotransferase